MRNRLNILDWLVHGGHQYEFFKLDHNFYCTNKRGLAPKYTDLGRPKNNNVKYLNRDEFLVFAKKADMLIARSPIKQQFYDQIKTARRGKPIIGIAVVQTSEPAKIPDWVGTVVWNSEWSMIRHKGRFPKKRHYYIPHGFDPNEFCTLSVEKTGNMLTSASFFAERGRILGFDNWKWVSGHIDKSYLIGHGNDGVPESIGSFSLNDLVRIYNSHKVYLNTTVSSAMPRSRGEAAMSGMPIVTTKNYGIEKYFINNKSCIFADNKHDMLKAVKRIINNNNLRKDLGSSAREAAVKHFNIKDYINKWDYVISRACR
tara:strand:- start:1289 stop:2230 length:942 start_codon:yes stop_codon:yes gene_type:complete